MKILFIGYSNLIKKRIIPILKNLPEIDTVCIAKYASQSWDDEYKQITQKVELYDNYESATQLSNATLAYISTTNNSHFELAMSALDAGMHTIIDKPATLLLDETEQLIRLATKKKRLLSESVVYLYHPQIELIRSLFEKERMEPKRLTVMFSFPPLNPDNFRYKKELGGGAFPDTSAYAVSVGRYFFNAQPQEAFYIENESDKAGLELSYSLLLKYPGGKSLVGHFGFTTAYINRLSILSEKINIDVDRIFTIPDNMENVIRVCSDNKSYEVKAKAGNTFETYLKHILKCLHDNRFNELYFTMHADAVTRDFITKNK